MKNGPTFVAILLVTFMALGATNGYARERSSRKASLSTLEGTVTAVESIVGADGERIRVARIQVDEQLARERAIVLAPDDTLRQIEFEIVTGDRLKVRVFLSDDDPVLAHKVMNVTRGTMVRLRTLSRIPLWDGNGRWQGGPSRGHHGAGRRGPRP